MALIARNLEFIEEKLDEGLLAGGIIGSVGGSGSRFLAQALEVGRGDLAGVEEQRGLFVVELVVGQAAHDVVEDELEAGRVLDEGQGELGALAGDLVVEAAEAAIAARGLAAGFPVELDVLAAGRLQGGGELRVVFGLVRGHGTPTPFILESTTYARDHGGGSGAALSDQLQLPPADFG
jgi:uncharacterized membrane protein YeaQ/YmgE (transglycosylase-associated protein family)